MTPLDKIRPACGQPVDPNARRSSLDQHRHRPRSGRATSVTILAVAALGVAVIAGYAFVRYTQLLTNMAAEAPGDGPQPAASGPAAPQAAASGPAAPQAGGRTVSTAPDKAEIRTPLVILRVGEGAGVRPVVALGHPEVSRDMKDRQGTRQGILERELIRQAILIAARDELGLSTRDELLDDEPPGTADGEPLEVALLFRRDECHALVRRGAGEKAEVLFQHDLGTRPDNSRYTAELTALAELLARSEFPALLQKLGLQGQPNRSRDDAAVPPTVEERLDQLGLVDHFAAVRALHEAIRADGESPARLSAMARAYAQLGMLTEYQWSPAHRVFKARAMLYAERLVARSPKSPAALRARAFVRALVGRQDEALADLDAANRITEETKDATPAPSWLAVIDAYLKSDRKRLAIPDGPHARLAALLSLMTVRYPHRTRVCVQAAGDLASRDADCCLAFDAICENGQLGEWHIATVAAPSEFTKIFPTKLKSLNSLPDSVKQALDQRRDEPDLVEALDKAGLPGKDSGELSWGVLAHLAREARFMHAQRRLHFMANMWHVPAADAFQEFRPLVARHRFYPFLQYIIQPRRGGIPALSAMADHLDMAEIEPTELPLIDALREIKHPAGEEAWGSSALQVSLLERDIAERLRRTNAARDHFGRILLNINPYSAHAMGILVEVAWDQVKGEVPTWREKVGDAPALIAALGRKYAELKQYDEAEKYLRQYMEISPDPWAYRTLAECYKARGDNDRWLATLDEFLTKTEPAGLEHAKLQVDIANDLMKRGRWADAKKYAEPAAETWAGWAMICASECNEGLKDWDRAELWVRRAAERYPQAQGASWYRFCKRTGHGDIQAARAFAEAHNQGAAADRPDPAGLERDGFSLWASGSPKQALEAMEQAAQAKPNAANLIAAFLLADEMGDKARRDRLLEDLCSRLETQVPRMVAIGRKMRDSLANGGKGSLDLAAVDRVLRDMPPKTRGNAEFLVGRFLLNRGQTESARKYLQLAADSAQTHPGLKEIAANSVRSPEAGKAQ
jgi:tetratricopeptide (TPR) repeat protein